jgi:hypothetical protein
MVRPRTINGLSVADAMRMRCEANQLLTRLLAEREISEERCLENDKRDPMKQVTGTSALDVAIRDARQMIEQVDAMLGEQVTDVVRDERPVVATITERLLSKPARAAAVGAAR